MRLCPTLVLILPEAAEAVRSFGFEDWHDGNKIPDMSCSRKPPSFPAGASWVAACSKSFIAVLSVTMIVHCKV